MTTRAKAAVRGEAAPAPIAGWKWLPVIDAERCTGCNACIDACLQATDPLRQEMEVCLELRERIAVLAHPQACPSDAHCVEVCPDDAMRMRWVPRPVRDALGRWRP
jgi:Fe-S-cluster-containing hydrogenase component 2